MVVFEVIREKAQKTCRCQRPRNGVEEARHFLLVGLDPGEEGVEVLPRLLPPGLDLGELGLRIGQDAAGGSAHPEAQGKDQPQHRALETMAKRRLRKRTCALGRLEKRTFHDA